MIICASQSSNSHAMVQTEVDVHNPSSLCNTLQFAAASTVPQQAVIAATTVVLRQMNWSQSAALSIRAMHTFLQQRT
jgi:hypothetical protein